MKKLLSCGLSALMCMTMFGCSSSNNKNNDQIELTFWGHQNEAWAASYQAIAKEFEEKNPGIHINFEFFPYDQFQSKVQTSLISNEGGADIYELWGGWGLDFANTGALAQIPEALTASIREDVYPSTIGSLEYDGKLFGLPLEFNIENGAMLVNDNLMKESNLTVPTTWEELRETARKATKKDGTTFTVKGFDFINWDSVPYLFLSMILSNDGTYQNADGTFNVQTPEAKAALQELYDMVKVDGVTNMEGLDGGGDMEGYQQLFAGRVAMVPRGPWTISEGETSFGLKYGVDFEYVSMPWFGDKAAFAAETGWSLAVNEDSKEKEAAFKFLEYFFQDDVLMRNNIACTQIPPKKSIASNPEYLEKMPYAAPLLEILDDSQFIGYFNTDLFKEKVNQTFQKLVSGDIPNVDSALVELEKQLNSILP